MLHRINRIALCLLVWGSIDRARAHAHGHHGHHDHHDHHDHRNHDHGNLRRNLGLFPSPPGLCKEGEANYTVGGVTYECEADFNAKGGQCGTEPRTKEQLDKFDQDFKAWKEAKEKEKEQRRLDGCGSNGCAGINWDGGEVITIPTYFHISHDGATGRKYTCDWNLKGQNPYADSDCKYIQDSILVMNQGFRGLSNTLFDQHPSAPAFGLDTGIQFCIADTTNSDNSAWYADNQMGTMKSTLDRGGMESLNIFVNNGGGVLGYAYYPTSSDNSNDGVVILNDSMPNGRPGWVYSQGDTLTHEVGHHLWLAHTHDGRCSGVGDYMDSVGGVTSNEREATFGCPIGLDNCSGDGGVNPIHSFMSYVEDACMTEFSEGQKERMQAAFEIYRYDAATSRDWTLAADGFSCSTDPVPTQSPEPPTPPPTRSPSVQPTPPPSRAPAPFACADITNRSACNNDSRCAWSGNPNRGSCQEDGGGGGGGGPGDCADYGQKCANVACCDPNLPCPGFGKKQDRQCPGP